MFCFHKAIGRNRIEAVVSLVTVSRPATAMSSLAAQFKAFNKASKSAHQAANKDALKAMTVEELETEKIAFGEAKKGVMFKDAFLDERWTEFILTRFEKSDKPEHMMYVRYVTLRMKQDQTPETKNAKGAPRPRPNQRQPRSMCGPSSKTPRP